MNPPPLVSIIINDYNYGRFVGAAIESALHQTYSRVAEVIAGYAGRIIALHQSNGGQAAAVNAGYARCRGDIAIFLDADDVLLPTVVGKVAATFQEEPVLARLQYRLAVVSRDGVPTGESMDGEGFRQLHLRAVHLASQDTELCHTRRVPTSSKNSKRSSACLTSGRRAVF